MDQEPVKAGKEQRRRTQPMRAILRWAADITARVIAGEVIKEIFFSAIAFARRVLD